MTDNAPEHAPNHVKIPTLRTPQAFNACMAQLGLDLRADEALLTGGESPLAQHRPTNVARQYLPHGRT